MTPTPQPSAEGIRVGSVLWEFDENNRVYREGSSGPIYEEHFVKNFIIGENKVSWIVSRYPDAELDSGLVRKVNKKTLIENANGFWRRCFYTNEGREQKTWIDQHRFRLAKHIEGCWDADLLRKIAQIAGYPPTPTDN